MSTITPPHDNAALLFIFAKSFFPRRRHHVALTTIFLTIHTLSLFSSSFLVFSVCVCCSTWRRRYPFDDESLPFNRKRSATVFLKL